MKKFVRQTIFTIMTIMLIGTAINCENPASEAIKKQVNPQQKELHKHFSKVEKNYNAANNELKKSKVFRESAGWLKEYYKRNGGKVVDFIGKLVTIGTDEGGKNAYIEIKSEVGGKEVTYKTWNNALSDMVDKTMIKLGSDIYKQLESVSQDDLVIFSGILLQDKTRGVREASLTEQGSATDPEILIRFTSIKKFDLKK